MKQEIVRSICLATRINDVNLHINKQQILEISFSFQFLTLCCYNVVHVVWLGLGTISTWLGSEKDHVCA